MKKLVQKRQEEIKQIYPGLTCFQEGVRQIPVESIPGVGELVLNTYCHIKYTLRYFSYSSYEKEMKLVKISIEYVYWEHL